MQNNFDNVSRFQSQSTSLATHKVLSQTYALLGVSLFPTVIGALMGMTMNWGMGSGFRNYVSNSHDCRLIWHVLFN